MQNSYAILEKVNSIEALCKIALKNASQGARGEIVGRYSGRTIEEGGASQKKQGGGGLAAPVFSNP